MSQLRSPLKLCSPLIQEAASKIAKEMGNQNNQINRIYPMSIFNTEAGKILGLPDGLTENDLHLILTYLTRETSRIVYDPEVSWPSSKSVQSNLINRPSSSWVRVRRHPRYRIRTKQ